MIREAIEKVVRRVNLSEDEMRLVFEEIMTGQSSPAQIGAFATALRMKGETVDEITGAVRVMREKSVKIRVPKSDETVIDTCGTGGSGANTFNISTTVAFVVAACGLMVAKHGNRAASSRCGSADVLEALGVKLDLPVDIVERCLRDIGIGFLYAPLFHGAMKYAVAPRREIGIRTIFNLLGPLSNPAQATAQVLGVYDPALTELLAHVLRNLGTRRAFVVCGEDALDEITVTAKTRVTELNGGVVKTFSLDPAEFGIKLAHADAIKGGDASENAAIVRSVLRGERSPRRDIVLLNAAAALVAGGRADDFRAGIERSAEAIDSGKALEKLERLIDLTRGKG